MPSDAGSATPAADPASTPEPVADTPPQGEGEGEGDEDTVEGIAIYKGVVLPYEASTDDIERLWPGTTAERSEYDELTVKDASGATLMYMPPEDEPGLCLAGPGMKSTDGYEVGMPLHAAPHSDRMSCQITVDGYLSHLGDPCPGYYSGVKLVCEPSDGDAFSSRLFFDLPSAAAQRSHEWVHDEQAEEFRDAKLAAVLEGYGGGGPDMEIFRPPAPKDDVSATPDGPRVVLARSRSGGLEMHNHVLATREAIEAALPGHTARKRTIGGFNVYSKDGTRVFACYTESYGTPVTSLSLRGPGFVDPRGIEVGMKFSRIKSLGSLTCEGVTGEDVMEVGCQLEGGPYYVFDFPKLKESDYGPLTLKRAGKILRGTPITSIYVE